MHSPMSLSIHKALQNVRKSEDDVLHVVYVSPLKDNCPFEVCNENVLMNFHCTLNDFLEATLCTSGMYDLVWPMEVQLVGDNWWLSWNNKIGWIYNEYPSREFVYKKPDLKDLIQESENVPN